MFPMRGFRWHFSFVTPPVTRQVETAVMFPACEMPVQQGVTLL